MDEQAIVLKYLELNAMAESEAVRALWLETSDLRARARDERAHGNELLKRLGRPVATAVGALMPRRSVETKAHAIETRSWAEVREEAAAALRAEGIEPSAVALPRSEHELDALDIAAALSFGALGALVPSLGSRRGVIQDAFHEIQQAADSARLPGLVQGVFGRHPAPFMDGGAMGLYHRFCDGHDLLTAVPAGVSKLGWVRGPLQVFQHLLTDSFGSTGIPLPGTDFIGQAMARGAGVSSITDLISPKALSRYASFRMSDAVASSATSFLLWAYGLARGIPEGSMRRPKLGVLAHGLCLLGVAACAAAPGLGHLVPFRSHINYVSLVAMSKHAWSWRALAGALTAQNVVDFERIRAATQMLEGWRTLEHSPIELQREFAAAAHMMAATELKE